MSVFTGPVHFWPQGFFVEQSCPKTHIYHRFGTAETQMLRRIKNRKTKYWKPGGRIMEKTKGEQKGIAGKTA
ncbi:MAG: hypothetical protein IJZ76_11910, partial [Lachnospiraceae bacterium]|nr:hypothetical protein [Lachnospiraceae bacterium]